MGAQELKRQMVKSFIDMVKSRHDGRGYHIIPVASYSQEFYDLTRTGSPLRKIAANFWVWEVYWATKTFETVGRLVADCPEFATDIIMAFVAKGKNGKAPFDGSGSFLRARHARRLNNHSHERLCHGDLHVHPHRRSEERG